MPPKTEKEKMLAGESYNFMDAELIAIRLEAKRLFRLFNQADDIERQSIIHQLLGQIGQNSIIEAPFFCTYGKNTYIGDDVYLNYNCIILDNNEVHIGNHVMIGPAVQLLTAAHHMQAEPRNQGLEVARPVVIEDNVWIGGGAIILPGVKIGRNAVVGAGTVIRRNVPANMVVAGNPAVFLRKIKP